MASLISPIVATVLVTVSAVTTTSTAIIIIDFPRVCVAFKTLRSDSASDSSGNGEDDDVSDDSIDDSSDDESNHMVYEKPR